MGITVVTQWSCFVCGNKGRMHSQNLNNGTSTFFACFCMEGVSLVHLRLCATVPAKPHMHDGSYLYHLLTYIYRIILPYLSSPLFFFFGLLYILYRSEKFSPNFASDLHFKPILRNNIPLLLFLDFIPCSSLSRPAHFWLSTSCCACFLRKINAAVCYMCCCSSPSLVCRTKSLCMSSVCEYGWAVAQECNVGLSLCGQLFHLLHTHTHTQWGVQYANIWHGLRSASPKLVHNTRTKYV